MNDDVSAPTGASNEFQRTIDEAIQNRDWGLAATLIETHWHEYVATDPRLLLDAIFALPTEAYRERPRLESGANYLEHLLAERDPHLYHDHTRAQENLALLDQLVDLTSRSAGHRTAGRIPSALRSAQVARRLLEEASDFERAEARNSLPDLLLQWARSLDAADSREAIQLYEEAYELAQLLGNAVIRRRSAASLAWLTAWQGYLSRAEEWVLRAHRGGPANPRYDAPMHLATALVHADRLEYDDAQQALSQCDTEPKGEYWAADLYVRSLLVETPGDATLVEDELALEERRQPRGLVADGANASYLTLARLRLGRVKGSPPHGHATGSEAVRHFHQAVRGIAGGEFRTALDEARSLADATGHPRSRAAGLLLAAALCARLGRRGSSSSALTRARAIIDKHRLYSTYVILPTEEVLRLNRDPAVLPLDPWVIRVLERTTQDAGIAQGSLSRREREVLQLLATEMPMNDIAQELFVSPNTIKSTARRLYRKLGVTSRADAADFADPVHAD